MSFCEDLVSRSHEKGVVPVELGGAETIRLQFAQGSVNRRYEKHMKSVSGRLLFFFLQKKKL